MTAIDDALAAGQNVTDTPVFSPVAAPRTGENSVPAAIITPRATPTLARRMLWEKRYRRRLRATDTIIILTVTALTTVVQLLVMSPSVLLDDPWVLTRVPPLAAATWLFMLAAFHTREPDVLGSGVLEYKRVAHATGLAFGILAIAFAIFQWQGLRLQLIIALPVGLVALLVGRWSWRRWLIRQRHFGHYTSRTVVVGSREDVEYVGSILKYDTLGYLVVGTTIFGEESAEHITVGSTTVPNIGTSNTIAQTASTLGADTIIVASRPHGDSDFIKRLSWQLEGTAAELVLSSRLADVAGPRMSFRQLEGLPLIHVRIPTFEGSRHLLKRALDVFVSVVALTVFAPIALILALAITIDSRGPVFFLQRRVGRDGREFAMVKFRSMRTTAEQELDALEEANEGSGPLFKLKADPRVTRVGRFIRKYSLDEVPQFWNVLLGDMSVVGPRPPLPTEVTAYDGTVFRRLYIKPGITGLWQVSGRSDLSWEESVRLDLRYVENWSVLSDLVIMWRTIKVMVRPSGAY